MQSQLLPEWHPQEAVILAWPDTHTYWRPFLPQVQQTYLELIQVITESDCGVILLCRPDTAPLLCEQLQHFNQVLMIPCEYNDTWVRDYIFLTCKVENQYHALEFCFNGWGNKFEATKDDQVNRHFLAELLSQPLTTVEWVMEGGALEIDETGYLLSTQSCLAQAQRNQQASFTDYQNMFAQYLGANNNHFFKYGYLQGDDTDGHIDNLVRFTPDQGLVVQACFNRELDEHFPELQALLKECEQHFPQHHISPLPLPQVYNQQRQRLPASYANYLINNEQILMPIYQQPEDKLAIDILQQAYPNYSIKPINALPLVQQFGSIHCSSMQVPKCTLKKAVLEQFKLGVTIWQV